MQKHLRSDLRLRGHPLWKTGKTTREKWLLPLRVRGDGAEFLPRDSLTSVSMTGLGAMGKTKALTVNLASFPL
eukprot:6749615-Pyramimonas_sp.AAC.1